MSASTLTALWGSFRRNPRRWNRLKWTLSVLVLTSLSLWAGYSMGYVAARNELAGTQQQGSHVVYVEYHPPDHPMLLFGDPEMIAKIQHCFKSRETVKHLLEVFLSEQRDAWHSWEE